MVRQIVYLVKVIHSEADLMSTLYQADVFDEIRIRSGPIADLDVITRTDREPVPLNS